MRREEAHTRVCLFSDRRRLPAYAAVLPGISPAFAEELGLSKFGELHFVHKSSKVPRCFESAVEGEGAGSLLPV